MEITVDRSGMWNVDHTAASYGFDSLYLQDVYRDTFIKSRQSIDKSLLEFASAKFAQQRQPFYAMVFTGTTHVPYDKLEDRLQPTWISESKSYTPYVRNYLEKVAFFDRQLGAFIERMKRDGTYDNTVFIIASARLAGSQYLLVERPGAQPAAQRCALRRSRPRRDRRRHLLTPAAPPATSLARLRNHHQEQLVEEMKSAREVCFYIFVVKLTSFNCFVLLINVLFDNFAN